MAELTHIENGLAVLKREGTYHARIRLDGKYLYRSLKTVDLAIAIKAAQKLLHKFEFSVEHGIPIDAKTFGEVIEEYVKFRRRENEQGRTSDGMLRQIKRVVRFWQAYAGDKLITAIGDAQLRDYVQWRRDYYTQRPNEAKKRNIKINPTDKTLQFDLMIGKPSSTGRMSAAIVGFCPSPPIRSRRRKSGCDRRSRTGIIELCLRPSTSGSEPAQTPITCTHGNCCRITSSFSRAPACVSERQITSRFVTFSSLSIDTTGSTTASLSGAKRANVT